MQPTLQHMTEECLIFPYNRLTGLYHLHTSFEILAPKRGTVQARLDDRICAVEPGNLLVIFPGVAHCYAPESGTEGTMLIFSAQMLADFEENWTEMLPARPIVRMDALHRDVRYCMERLDAMAASGRIDVPLARAYLSLMFIWLIPALAPEESATQGTRDVLYRAMAYMSQNYKLPLDIRGTARALGVNTYYLSHILNERLHMSFRAYLNALRIDRARRYLRMTSRPIEEIAAACGFANLRTFDRVFFERCGCTPRDFRKSVAQLRREEQARRALAPDADPAAREREDAPQ